MSTARDPSDRVEAIRQRARRLDADLQEAREELLRGAQEFADVTLRYQKACSKADRLRGMMEEAESRIRRAFSEIRRLCSPGRESEGSEDG